MKVGIASNIVLDDIISNDGKRKTRIGGPACYCGLTSRKFKFEVILATRVGHDFEGYAKELGSYGVNVGSTNYSDHPTTRFELKYDLGDERHLLLKSKCGPITPDDIDSKTVDAWLISPVADEIPSLTLDAVKRNAARKALVMLDPQGFLREFDQSGNVRIVGRPNIDLSGIDAIKTDPCELAALTGGLMGIEGMVSLASKGITSVLSTENRRINLLHENTLYWIKLQEIECTDTTGAGDILSAGFLCAFLRENDPLWALSFGAGALIAALESKAVGLDKVPEMSRIEQNASYFYNLAGFRKL